MARVSVGTIVESEFGRGPVTAITKEWLVHDTEDGEAALLISDMPFWIPVDEDELYMGGGQHQTIGDVPVGEDNATL